MKENGSISIAVVRHGNLNVESTFECIQHSEEAIVDQDFHSNGPKKVITMGINESVAFCTLRGIDDDMWEGPENLRYSLRPSDGYSLLGQKSEANIKLVDPEDSECVRGHSEACSIFCKVQPILINPPKFAFKNTPRFIGLVGYVDIYYCSHIILVLGNCGG